MCDIWEPPQSSSQHTSRVNTRPTTPTGGALRLYVSPPTDPPGQNRGVATTEPIRDGQKGDPAPLADPSMSAQGLFTSPEQLTIEIPADESRQHMAIQPAREIPGRSFTTMPPRRAPRGPHVRASRIIMTVSLLVQVCTSSCERQYTALTFRL